MYKHILEALKDIRDRASNASRDRLKGWRSSVRNIYKILGSAAHSADCFDDALDWMEKYQESYLDGSVSEVQYCAAAASLAALKLHISPEDKKIESLLTNVIGSLTKPLKSDSADLDELLVEVSKLRRAAISLL